MSKSETRGVISHLATVGEHLLKLEYARGIFREYKARSCRVSVRSARRQVRKLLNESPSLRPQLEEMLADAYEDGRIEAWRYPGMSDDELPASSPWTVEQVMDDDFLTGHTTTRRDRPAGRSSEDYDRPENHRSWRLLQLIPRSAPRRRAYASIPPTNATLSASSICVIQKGQPTARVCGLAMLL